MDENYTLINNEILRLKKEFTQNLRNYSDYIDMCLLDAPIEVLCLPSEIVSILHRENVFRVFELSRCDLTKIKGIGDRRRLQIEARLREFAPI